jgi:hypothetical protein
MLAHLIEENRILRRQMGGRRAHVGFDSSPPAPRRITELLQTRGMIGHSAKQRDITGWPRSCWPAEGARSPHFYGTTFVEL